MKMSAEIELRMLDLGESRHDWKSETIRNLGKCRKKKLEGVNDGVGFGGK